ncbi:MAG: hypothetical protein ACRC2T_17315, partial [Thermoguttaceae bacterium]
MNITGSIMLFCCVIFSTLLFAHENEQSTVLSPTNNPEFRELFQNEKYAQAEALYLKIEKTPDVYWIALLKLKQGQTDDAIRLLKDEISRQNSFQQKTNA